MSDPKICKDQIVAEISTLRKRLHELEGLEVTGKIEHQQALRALQRSEDKFYKAFHCCPHIITISTLEEGQYIEVNDAFSSVVGYEPEEVVGRSLSELYIWEVPEERDRILKTIEEQGSIRNMEMRFLAKSGQPLTTLISADKIDIAGEKQLLFVVKDISDRKKMEESLRVSEELFYKAFNASPLTMSITTVEEGLFLDINNSFCRTLGGNRSDILGHTSHDIDFWLNINDRDEVKESILNNIPVSNKEIQFRRISGEKRVGLYSAERVEIAGQICILSFVHDLTERKQMEIEISRLDRLNLVGEMAASIGHEIRNPMTTVRGYLQLLRENPAYIDDLECMDLMLEELDSANEIITEFLSLAKNKTVELKAMNLNSILKSIYPLLQANAMLQDKEIMLEMQELPELMLDDKEIRILIFNLVNNGLDAIQPGNAVKIKTYIDDSFIILAVQDKGCGISQDILKELGTPFFTTKENRPGLGLAVCYGIAARHKAKIDIQTEVNSTNFLVKFFMNDI